MTNKSINGAYLLPLNPMGKLKGGTRFDISLGEVKSPASHIQSMNLEPGGTVVSQGLHLKNPRKDRQCFPGARTQDLDGHGSVALSTVCCSALMVDGVLLQDQDLLRSKQLEKEAEQSSQISVTFCSRSAMSQSYYRQCKETAFKL